jgi:hypothetical protein
VRSIWRGRASGSSSTSRPPGQALRRASARGRRSTSSAWAFSSRARRRGRWASTAGSSARAALLQLHRRRLKPIVIAISAGPRCPGPRGGGAGAEPSGHAVARTDFCRRTARTIHCQTRPARRYAARPRDRGRSPVSPGACAGPRDDAPDAPAGYTSPRPPIAADGGLLPRFLLPGYSVFARPTELQLLLLLIPGGATRRRTQGAPSRASHGRSAPRSALGRPGWSRCAAPLRLGGVPRSTGDHVLVIGDAAGHMIP